MKTQSRHRRPSHNANYQKRQMQFQDQQQQQVQVRPGKVEIGQDYYDEEQDAVDRDKFYATVKDSFESSNGQELYSELNRLVSRTHRPLGYKEARKHLYGEVDRRPDGGLYYLYSGEGPKQEEEVKGPAQRELGNYNCEHVVPQSWFQKASTPRADLHHLFTEQVQCNGSRGNYPLEELVEGEALPQCGVVQNEGDQAFEPHGGKGEVARATLYFITRYPGEVGDADHESHYEDLQQLLEWHEKYPVSDYERHRNDTIEDVQGNRNPFIDYPELARKVDFSRAIGHAS